MATPDLMGIFLNSDNELRSGWKFGVFVIVLVLAFGVFGIAASLVAMENSLSDADPGFYALNAGVTFLASIAASLFMTRFVDRTSLSSIGISLHKEWIKDFGLGIVIAAAMLLITVIGCAVFGDVDIRPGAASTASAMLMSAALLVQAAAFEEIVFRGYPMQSLMRGIGTWPAVLVMSILFGLVHANNPNASRLGIINTILAGIVLSAAFLKTRSLWLPYGIHLGWNAGLGMVLGFSLSGIHIASFWTTAVDGRPFLVGDGYGPEGGIVGTIGFAAGLLFLGLFKARRHSEEKQ